jgi:anti-sigma regulatory factor (Ser/Thr protein kinase)
MEYVKTIEYSTKDEDIEVEVSIEYTIDKDGEIEIEYIIDDNGNDYTDNDKVVTQSLLSDLYENWDPINITDL